MRAIHRPSRLPGRRDSQPGGSQQGDSQQGDSQPGDSQPGGSQRGDVQRRGFARAVVAVVLGLVAPLSVASSAPAAELPGGKANFVVSLIGGPVNAVAVKLATYEFHGNGTVTQRYWSWRQDSLVGKGNATWAKPPSGYTTAGCRHACPIRTPVGFQHGLTGSTLAGTWQMTSGNLLTIRWASSYRERWSLNTGTAGLVGAQLFTDGSTARGWAVGSNAPLGRAVDMRAIYASDRLYGPMAQNNYGAATTYQSIGFHAPDYTLCSSGLCMQGNGVTAADKSSWFSSYWAANPASDGRKVFWNNQTGAVQQVEAPGSDCISPRGGGHTDALLQAIDDSGRFVGFVGVEASLNQRKPGQAVVNAFTMVLPSVLSAVS